jgi:hypothetical protein
MFTFNQHTGQSFHLSKKEYREKSGITALLKWWGKYLAAAVITRQDGTQQVLGDYLSKFPSFLTTDSNEYMKRLSLKWECTDQLWTLMTFKARNNKKFTTHGKRKQTVAEFFKKITKETREKGKVPLFLYGDASFASSSKGEMPGPTKGLVKFALPFAPVLMTDEYLTSQVCNGCAKNGCACVINKEGNKEVLRVDHPIRERVAKQSAKEKREKEERKMEKVKLHNVVWCTTNKRHNFMKRDLNAAKNMAWIGETMLSLGVRPEAFCHPKPCEEKVKVVQKKRKVTLVATASGLTSSPLGCTSG